MEMPSSTKIEHRAVNALEAIIDEHLTMEHQFNENDKEMSWDGYIWLCKENNGVQSKHNFDARISVQIKGHTDPHHKFLNCDKISYPVELSDLDAYATEKGVLYFQIFLDGLHREIFYASLYPSKIADYLDAAKKKKNKRTYNIPFLKLEKDSQKLYIIVKQFSDESMKQGSAYTPLVQDRIRCDDFDKLKSVTLTVVGARDSYDVLLRLSSGDVCLYGKTADDKYPRPMEWPNRSKFFIGKEVYQKVSIGKEVFYSQYRCIADSDGGMVVILSPNLEWRITEKKFNFKVVSTLKALNHDARFLLTLKEVGSCFIARHEVKCTDSKLLPEAKYKLKFIVDLYETLEMIDFGIDVKISDLAEEQLSQFMQLVNLRLGLYSEQLKGDFLKYVWIFENKFVPLLIEKKDDKIELSSAIYTSKFAIFLPSEENEDERGYRLPLFTQQDAEVLGNLYRYDYDAFRNQLDSSDINETTSDTLLECVLKMISVYDINGYLEFLDLAEYFLQKLEPYIQKELFLLNQVQIRKRKGIFNSDDIMLLNGIDCDSAHIMFGKNVLLGHKEEALTYFRQFPEEAKTVYKSYPIYKLFTEL